MSSSRFLRTLVRVARKLSGSEGACRSCVTCLPKFKHQGWLHSTVSRILRPKQATQSGFNAFFYTLVSIDTQEMFYSTKRQQYLVDQGYSFKVLTNLVTAGSGEASHLSTTDAELKLLREVLCAEVEANRDALAEDRAIEREMQDSLAGASKSLFRRSAGVMSALSGADGETYLEYDGS